MEQSENVHKKERKERNECTKGGKNSWTLLCIISLFFVDDQWRGSWFALLVDTLPSLHWNLSILHCWTFCFAFFVWFSLVFKLSYKSVKNTLLMHSCSRWTVILFCFCPLLISIFSSCRVELPQNLRFISCETEVYLRLPTVLLFCYVWFVD